MSELENEGTAPTPAETPAETPATSAPIDTSAFATKEDVQQIAQGLNFLTQMFAEPEEPQYEADEDGQIDIESYITQAVDSRLQPVRPLLDATVKERGEKVMQEIFTRLEGEVGEFDHKLAERVAQSFLNEHGGDPVKATEAGAKYAAEVRTAEREAGKKNTLERLQRGPQDYDPGVDGGGNRIKPKFKSKDDVIAHWAGETEL